MSIRDKIAIGAVGASISLVAGIAALEQSKTPEVVYLDTLTASATPTVCAGITNAISPYPVIMGDTWTPERCAEVNQMVADKEQRSMAMCLKRSDTPLSVIEGMTMFSHNVGTPSACTSEAAKAINQGRFEDGCRLIAYKPNGTANWSSVFTGKIINGKRQYRFVQGLHNARKENMSVCLSGLD